MRQERGIRYLAVAILVLFVAGCSEMYAYTPSVGGSSPPAQATAAPPAAAQPQPAAETPPPKPDLPQQVQSLEARVQQLENRVAELESRSSAPAPAAKYKGHTSLPTSKALYPAPPAASDQVYTEGYRLHQAKKYGKARAKFSRYLKEQPQGPKAAEARYYLADSFYQEGKYQEAKVEFGKLVNEHPRSILAPAAMLRQALAYQNLQEPASYHGTLNRLIKAYPKSPEAKEAAKWLKQGKKKAVAKAPAKSAPKAAPKAE
jgi:tol-pal system protein YbgF